MNPAMIPGISGGQGGISAGSSAKTGSMRSTVGGNSVIYGNKTDWSSNLVKVAAIGAGAFLIFKLIK